MGGWAPRMQKQKILDHNNSIKLSQKDFSQIGFMTYHLEDYIVFIKKDKDSNFFEFDIEDIWEDENIIQDSFIIDGKILLPTNSKNKLDLLGKPLIKKKI